jgi:hypothetical protein
MLARIEIREVLEDNVVEVNGPLHSPCWLPTSNIGDPWLILQVAWSLRHGIIPKRWEVRQHCNNAFCCNPSHLYRAKDEMSEAAE